MVTQLKIIPNDKAKPNSFSKTLDATDEVDDLITFNRSITQAMASTIEYLSEGVFINMANPTLTRRDSYMDYLKAGIKHDTLTALRNSPLHTSSLFPDHLLSNLEEEISHHEQKRSANTSFHPYIQSGKQTPEVNQKFSMEAVEASVAEQEMLRQGLQLSILTDQGSEFT